MADDYESQLQTAAGTWQRRDEEGKFTKGTKNTPYKNLPQETPGKGND